MTTDEQPFWGYSDLALFIGMAFPCIAAAFGIVILLKRFAGASLPMAGLIAQLVLYVLLFGVLALLFRTRYDRPFWSSLGWRFSLRTDLLCFAGGPLLALSVGALGYLIHTPQIELHMFDEVTGHPAALALLGILAVVFGPIAEELAFRGFLMPLLMRSLGVAGGIVLTGIVFGSLHGAEYDWSWRHILLLSLVGCILGWVRHAARSTAASTFVHAAFNLTQFAAFISQSK